MTKVKGVFDLRHMTLPGFPKERQVRNYVSQQWPVEKIIAPSQELVDAGLRFIGLGNVAGQMVGVTVDCVYGTSHAELFLNLEKKYKVLGSGTLENMLAAALGVEDLGDLSKLDKNTIATRLMTVVLQHFHSKRRCLIALVPLNSESGVLISKVVLEVRRLVFARKSWLVFAGGDGASPVREAWRLVKLESKGDANTDLRVVERVAVIKVAAASGMSEGLRSTLPYSEANETFHGILRRVDLHLRISAVAKGASKILAVMMLIADPARSWPWRVGVGPDSCYQSRPVHKHT